jgi:hypothetical protein
LALLFTRKLLNRACELGLGSTPAKPGQACPAGRIGPALDRIERLLAAPHPGNSQGAINSD